MTDRKAYESRNIIEYRNGAYVAVHRPSTGHAGEMAVNMREADAASFLQWLGHWWPLQTETEIMRLKGEADAASDIISLAPV